MVQKYVKDYDGKMIKAIDQDEYVIWIKQVIMENQHLWRDIITLAESKARLKARNTEPSDSSVRAFVSEIMRDSKIREFIMDEINCQVKPKRR